MVDAQIHQDDWDYLARMSLIHMRPNALEELSEMEVRLQDAGYAIQSHKGEFRITAAGRRALKARDAGECY